MIIYSQTHTLKDKQKHNQNNIRQKYKFGDDVNPKRRTPDMSLIKLFGKWVLRMVPPKNIEQCYCKNLEI